MTALDHNSATLIIDAERSRLRPWNDGDIDSLVKHADNRNIWRNVGERFPHPYTREAAEWWLDQCRKMDPEETFAFAIEVGGEAIGGVGYERLQSPCRRTAQIGYWVSEEYWGRGIATDAVKAVTRFVFSCDDIVRAQALVYGWNAASGRVLEKAGYELEGTPRRHLPRQRNHRQAHLRQAERLARTTRLAYRGRLAALGLRGPS